MEMVKTIVTIVTTLGGFEGIKWLMNRKSNKVIAEASADTAEIKAEESEFTYLRGRVEFAEQQLLLKEQRFAEQTSVLRDAQRDLLNSTLENGKLQAEIARLNAERAMKLCERRGCKERLPQSGY